MTSCSLEVGIGAGTIPGPAFPCEVPEAGIAAAVQAGAQVDQSFWPVDQAGEDVGCERVDGEDRGQAVDRGDAFPFPVADPGVVDDGVEGAELVGAGGHGFGFGDAAEIAGDGECGAGGGCHGVFGALGIAGVEDDAVPLGNQEMGGDFAKAVGGAGDKNPGHGAKLWDRLEIAGAGGIEVKM